MARLLKVVLLLGVAACGGKENSPVASRPAVAQSAPTAAAAQAPDPIFGLPQLAGTTVEFRDERIVHARIAGGVRATVTELLKADGRFAVTRFDSGTRLVAMDGSGRSLFVYRLPGEPDTLLTYFAASTPQEAADGSAQGRPAPTVTRQVRRGALAPGAAAASPSGGGGIKVGSDGRRFERPNSLPEMQRLLERPATERRAERRVVPNEPILDGAGRPTGYERTLYGRVVRSEPAPRVTAVRRNDASTQY